MTKVVNRIPTVDDKVFAIEQDFVSQNVPSILRKEDKEHFIKIVYYAKKSFIVDSVSRSSKSPETHVNVTATNGISIEFPKFIDTPEKLNSRFYSSEEEVDKEIEALTILEIERCEAVIEEITKQRATLKEIITNKNY